MSRRGFFAGLGSLVASVAAGRVVSESALPDAFDHRGFRVWWSGWRQPANQDALVGWWVAAVPPDENRCDMLVFTTGGVLQRSYEAACIDVSHLREWPLMTARATDGERNERKQRAAAALIGALDG